ncbi:hypothetical protein DYB25_007565 [Aphanomyces astaci]|uniref:Integrator complex subunit 5 C-terminal domain-containing protein n=1 Tax=Aphanomyces astaci TaxID=112090 RepID=A0A397BZI1_APHAT|nr:hypothetical protein DYB25_007565 [Aphanomyces astaci]RHY57207.1 hypothetical protein DYB38_004675 [Aphanomyces astaci]
MLGRGESHPLSALLLNVLRKCVKLACIDVGDTFKLCMDCLVEWIVLNEGANWTWLLAFAGRVAPKDLTAYSLAHLVTGAWERSHAVVFTNLDAYLAVECPWHVTKGVVDVLDKAIAAENAPTTVSRLLNLLGRGANVTRACDAKFTTLLTIPRVSALMQTCGADVQAELLDVLQLHSAVLSETPVHLLPLLDDLSGHDAVGRAVAAWLHTTKCDAFVDRLVDALPYIHQHVKSSSVLAPYVAAITTNAHRTLDRTHSVCQAFIRLHDLGPTSLDVNALPSSTGVCLDLLAADLTSAAVAPQKKRRVLALMLQIIHQGQDRWTSSLAAWKQAHGVSHWQLFLTLAASSDAEISLAALQLMQDVPYPTLEDPLWQYRCLHDLLRLFFSLFDDVPRLELVKKVLSTIMRESGGVLLYPASVTSTFVNLVVDAVVSADAPTTVPHDVPQEMNFFRGKKPASVARHLCATNCLRPYSPFPKSVQQETSDENQVDVFSQLQTMRLSSVVAPSQFESHLLATRARDMQRAISCCEHVQELLYNALNLTSFPASFASADVLVDAWLERTLPVAMFIPPDDHYREVLPERSNFDIDLRMEQWVYRYPCFIPLTKAAVLYSSPQVAARCLPLLKAVLVVLVNFWHARRFQKQANGDASWELHVSIEVMSIVEGTGWVPEPLNSSALLFPHVSAMDIRSMLHAVWMYLADHPPFLQSPAKPDEAYQIPIQNAIHNNIHSIGHLFGHFSQ